VEPKFYSKNEGRFILKFYLGKKEINFKNKFIWTKSSFYSSNTLNLRIMSQVGFGGRFFDFSDIIIYHI